MECIDDKKYFDIVCCEEVHNEEKITNRLGMLNATKEFSAENSLSDTDVGKACRETKKMYHENVQLHELGSGASLNRKSVDLSECADVIRRSKKILASSSSFQRNELASENQELQFVKPSINSGDEKGIDNNNDRKDQSTCVMGAEIESLISDLQTVSKLLRNNNSKTRNSDRNATPSSYSANKPKNNMKRSVTSRQSTESILLQDSDESVVSMLCDRSSDNGFSSLYSNVETLDRSISSEIDYSTSIVSESSYTVTEDDRRRCYRGKIQHVNAQHEYSLSALMTDHQPHSDQGKTRVPVVLKAEAMYNNGELEITVRDDRNRCPQNVDIKITVVHGVPKKRVNSKFAAYSVVPRFPGIFALDRDVVKHRAMRPAFNTRINPEAVERYGRIFRSK